MALINCSECGHQVSDKAKTCPNCGCPIEIQLPPPIPEPSQPQQAQATPPPPQPTQQIGVFDNGPSGKSRGVAALFAFFLGGFGVHYFYVGKIGAGILFLIGTLIFCWTILIPLAISIICLIQTIRLFIMTHEEFEQTYVNSTTFMPI